MNTIKHFNNLDQPSQARIWQAIDLLCKDNPNAVVQLEKLADLKVNNPVKWKFGCTALKIPS